VKGQVGRAIALFLSIAVARAGFIVLAEVLGQGVVDETLQLGRPFGSLVGGAGSLYALAGFFLSIPYVTAIRFLGYIDLRTRKEGWDVQLRFSALQQAAQKAAA
jgi:hypothetical protein